MRWSTSNLVKIHYIGEWISARTQKKQEISEISYWGWKDRNLIATSVFVSMMRMIFIFGFAKKYLLEKKL